MKTPRFPRIGIINRKDLRDDGERARPGRSERRPRRSQRVCCNRRPETESSAIGAPTSKSALHLVTISAIAMLFLSAATSPARADEWKFPCPQDEIAHYTAYHISEPIHVDGKLDESVWQKAPRSPRYVDIITGKPALYDTRATILWDDQNLYVGVRLEEPLVHAKYTTNNSPIYYDNDTEVFIAGRDSYYEFEINGFNTTYEVFFVWDDAYQSDGFAQLPDFQRADLQPFNGVGFTNHPRGGRLGNFNWHFPGKKTAVFIDGTMNNDTDRDRGWSVELAFPWKGMKLLAEADHRALPPKEGDVWRMDFSRFNTYKEAPPANDSGGWVMTRHGVWDSHIPECFAYIRFSTNDVSTAESGK